MAKTYRSLLQKKHYIFTLWFLCLVALNMNQSLASDSAAVSYEEIDWVALMPEDDLSALMNRPEFLNDIADGSAEDSLDSFASQMLEDEQAQRYQSALVSTRVIDAFDGKAIRIHGFIVPLEQNSEQLATTFLWFRILVRVYTCLHHRQIKFCLLNLKKALK